MVRREHGAITPCQAKMLGLGRLHLTVTDFAPRVPRPLSTVSLIVDLLYENRRCPYQRWKIANLRIRSELLGLSGVALGFVLTWLRKDEWTCIVPITPPLLYLRICVDTYRRSLLELISSG